ncbi:MULTISPECIES: ribosomal protein S18-alanine N-acetyltransferase [Hyphobacterium]|uniref:[Ribosomal protein bS18]-alanine N-acetyltransferase n=1 Tax=Hyphobacterium vulgare TaxID=1736751 RepID=A0ABV6ZX61_9PROT
MTPDFTALARIHAEGFDRPWSASELERLAAMDGMILTIRPEAGEPVGFALLQSVLDEAEVLTLAVTRTARGHGRGRALLEAAESAARERGARRVFLDVSDRNRAGLALYRAAGFRETGRRRAYYSDGSDAILMEKTLPGLDASGRTA